MKYSILLAALLSVATVAQAEDNRNFLKVEAVKYNYDSAPNDKYGVNLQVGREVLPGIKLDIKQEARVEENTQKLSNRFEGGIAYEQKIPFVKVGVRGAIGEKYTSGDAFGYWLVEPSVAYDVTNDISVKGSWRYRNAFDSDKHDATNTYKVGVDYKYTTSTSFNLALGKTTGDQEYTAFQGGVTYKF
jgi:hypothetical protein